MGADDERDLFPTALRLIEEMRPSAVMLENVKGLASEKFKDYRDDLLKRLRSLGYCPEYKVVYASDYGVPQLRPRFLLVALQEQYAPHFEWPKALTVTRTVGEVIGDLMASGGWQGAEAWKTKAASIAPTIVGGSKKHGGPDLGPTRARAEWAKLGVDGLGIADAPPSEDFAKNGNPRLTLRMVARVQGFPDAWQLVGGKTAAYRQIGNAFPPPVAEAVAGAIRKALLAVARKDVAAQRLAKLDLFELCSTKP